ncbi:MAG: class I SAM-dependent methyltransferase [Patescibacteria group bacterium]
MHPLLIIIILGALLILTIGLGIFIILAMVGMMLYRSPFLPLPLSALNRVNELLTLSDTSIAYDLGSGSGRVVRHLARQNKNARVVGIEGAPLPRAFTFFWSVVEPLPNTEYLAQNILTTPLNDATHVFVYLFPYMMPILSKKFGEELQPDTIVVSCDFRMADRTPTRTLECIEGSSKHTLYQYTF